MKSLHAQAAGSAPVNNDTCAATVADATLTGTKDNEKIDRNVSAWTLDDSDILYSGQA